MLNISSNSEVNQPSECLRTHLGKGGKLVESFNEAEELQGDAGGDDQQAHGEQDQATQLLEGPNICHHSVRLHCYKYLCMNDYSRLSVITMLGCIVTSTCA